MGKDNEATQHENEIFLQKVLILCHKIFAAIEGESVNIRLSSLLSILLNVSQDVSPEDKFVIGACMEDCMKILGVTNRIDTIH